VVGRSEREARDLLAEYAGHASAEATLAHASASLGIDLARYGMDQPIEARPTNAIQSNAAAMACVAGPAWTKRALLAQSVLGSRQPPIVGSPAHVADALQAWVAEADVDGFNLSRTVMPECLESFIEMVVPVLQERGVYKSSYAPGTYRDKLFDRGPSLPAEHPAAAHRPVGAGGAVAGRGDRSGPGTDPRD